MDAVQVRDLIRLQALKSQYLRDNTADATWRPFKRTKRTSLSLSTANSNTEQFVVQVEIHCKLVVEVSRVVSLVRYNKA